MFMSPARKALIGAFLFAARSDAFYAPITSSLARRPRELRFHSLAGIKDISSSRRRCRSGNSTRMMSSMQENIESKLREALSPVHLEVINESHMHSGPATESHFKVC